MVTKKKNKNLELKFNGTQEVMQEEKINVKGKRTPMHKQQRTGIKERLGYTRHLVNEVPGRIDRLLEAGWTPVDGEEQSTADHRLQQNSKMGSLYRPLVNYRPDALCQTGVWMEIPTELYNEDQRDKALKNDKIEEMYDPRKSKEVQSGEFYGAKYNKS